MKILTHYSLQVLNGLTFLNLILPSAFCLLLFFFLPVCAVQGQSLQDSLCSEERNQLWCHHSRFINCPKGDHVQNEKNAVVRIYIPGEGMRSGALVNTTANGSDNRHFVLTCGHALPQPLQTINPTWRFDWHYEYVGCPPCTNPLNQPPPPVISTYGATVVARFKRGANYFDFALLELHEDPAEAWDVTPYYLGWDRSEKQEFGSGIHHPASQVKMVYNTGLFYFDNVPDWAWEFTGHNLILLSGSSGSPLLNHENKLIGNNNCKVPYGVNYGHRFSKFSLAWNGHDLNSPPSQRLRDWLDPLGLDPMSLEGRGGCQKTIRLDRMLSFSRTYHAVQNIISKQKIESESTIVYKAGNDIHLIEGFHAKAGSNFHALIETLEGCDNLAPPPPPPKASQNETITTKELDTDSFQLFPNPATNTVTIEGAGIAQVEIYDVYGRKLLEQNAERRTQKELNVSGLQAGVYLVKIYSENNQVVVKRLVIAK